MQYVFAWARFCSVSLVGVATNMLLKIRHIVGDGSCDHLDDQNIPLPDEIKLTTGLFEVGTSAAGAPDMHLANVAINAFVAGREGTSCRHCCISPYSLYQTCYVAARYRTMLPYHSAIAHHSACLCIAENDKLSITDLNSTNGTYIDDEELVPMRAMEISLGAEVTFG